MVDRHRAFDRTALLPDYLQDRLDGWQANPPAHQHQTYGPWNAYLQGQKFLAEHFLVKPQALLREETATNANDMSIESIDSHGVAVTHKRHHPDFNIDQYWGADNDDNQDPDKIRVVIEIGSLAASKLDVAAQLEGYMEVVGERGGNTLLGLGIIGNQVLMLRQQDGVIARVRAGDGWVSIFHNAFVNELNRVRDLWIGGEA